MSGGVIGRVGNLPCEPQSFVGRQRETDEVKRLVSRSRLVTLTGPGGTGKTRLAVRVATDLARGFPDGVWFVDLARVGEPRATGAGQDAANEVAYLVEATLGLRQGLPEQAGGSPLRLLTDQLADWRALVVMDNADRLAPICAAVADTLLAGCPGLRLVVTSRERLKAGGEAVFTVPPLPAPEPGQSLDLAAAGRYDSVALFVARAEAALPGFALTEENYVVVADLCRRLDGLPLAIELAAGRIRVLAPQQILDRLTDRFVLLRWGNRTAPDRQQTLWGCVSWSYETCDPVEQVLWARLSVFAGGFELDAAEGICTDPGLTSDGLTGEGLTGERLLRVVTDLVEKSILVRQDDGKRVRYRMLETIRDYGRAALASTDEEAHLRRRHADWYLLLAERAERNWFGPDQARWCRRIRAEHANLRSAFDTYLGGADDDAEGDSEGPGRALRLVAALWFYWLVFALMAEGRDWLRRAIEATATTEGIGSERAKALWIDGHLASVQGDLDAAVPRLEAAHDLAHRVGDDLTQARALKRLGAVAMHRGDLELAEGRLAEALRRLAVLCPPADASLAHAKLALALTRFLRGDATEAAELAAELRTMCQAHGDQYLLAYTLNVLARAESALGHLDAAAGHVQEAVGLRRDLPQAATLGFSLDLLAWITAAAGDQERAATLIGSAQRVWLTVGSDVRQWSHLQESRRQTEQRARRVLGGAGYDAAVRRGTDLTLDLIIRYALGIPVDPRPGADGISSTGLLTRRETEIAELLAEGLSNKQIAERLVLAQRTVEGHVQMILTKLGFRSRTQVAAWVHDRDRLPIVAGPTRPR